MTRAPKQLWKTADEKRLVDAWAAAGLADRTIQLYMGAVRTSETWCKAHGYKLRTLPAFAARELSETLPLTWSSRRRLRSALRAYWEAVGRRNPPLNAIRVPKKPQMHSRALYEEDAATLERTAREREDAQGLAVLLGLYLGLRRAEIAALRWSDFEPDFSWVTVTGKGDVTASLPVHPLLVSALQRFRSGSNDFVFPGRFGGGVTPTTVWQWVKEVAEEAQLGPVTTHVLRHTCLTSANDATGDLRAVQFLARHARPDTTAGYTRVNTKRMLRAVLALDYKHLAQEAKSSA